MRVEAAAAYLEALAQALRDRHVAAGEKNDGGQPRRGALISRQAGGRTG